MKYNITLSQETLNKVVEMLEGENSLNAVALENAKGRIVVLERELVSAQEVIDNTLQTNATILVENSELIKKVRALEEQIALEDVAGEKLKNQKLEEKLESFRIGRDKERELNKGFVIEILKTFGIAVSEEISTLIGERDYFKAAAKINAEIKKEAKKIAATKTERKG